MIGGDLDADATDASMSDLRQTMRAAGRVIARLIARAGKTSPPHFARTVERAIVGSCRPTPSSGPQPNESAAAKVLALKTSEEDVLAVFGGELVDIERQPDAALGRIWHGLEQLLTGIVDRGPSFHRRTLRGLALAKALRCSAIARSTGSLVIARPPVRGMPSTSRPIVARAIIAADHDAGDADEVIE